MSDQDEAKPLGYDLPPATPSGALPPTSPTKSTASTAGAASVPVTANGAIEKEEDWEKVGWAPRFGNPGDHDESGTLLDHQDYLEGKIPDQFFGGMR